MTSASLAIALLGLLLAVLAFRATSRARREIGDLYALVFSTKNNLTEDLQTLKKEIPRLARLEADKAQGRVRFVPDMLIVDAIALHPEAKSVMAAHHMGSCSGCSVSTTETIGEGARSYGLDVDALLRSLNELLDPARKPSPAPASDGNSHHAHGGEKVIAASSIPFLPG